MRVPPAGIIKMSAAVPSAPRTVPSIPGVSDACTITAPAPSPNRIEVVRSVKSRILLKISAPTVRTVSAIPAWTKAVALARP